VTKITEVSCIHLHTDTDNLTELNSYIQINVYHNGCGYVEGIFQNELQKLFNIIYFKSQTNETIDIVL